MTKARDLHRSWSGDPEYRAAYDALEGEFALARILIEARSRARLSQAQLAARMQTSQSYIARIEGGRVRPSTAVLERLAKATGTRLQIRFVPARRGSVAQALAKSHAGPVRTPTQRAAAVVRAQRDAS